MCVGHPAEKLDQNDVATGLRRPTDGIDRAAHAGSQNRRVTTISNSQTSSKQPACNFVRAVVVRIILRTVVHALLPQQHWPSFATSLIAVLAAL